MPKTILLADDSKSMRDILKLTLQFKGYTVIEATDGAEAYEILKQTDCDLLITDISMPNMSGLELLKKVREELKREMPIIICSADKDANEEEYLRKGANKFLAKPVPPLSLLEVLEGLI